MSTVTSSASLPRRSSNVGTCTRRAARGSCGIGSTCWTRAEQSSASSAAASWPRPWGHTGPAARKLAEEFLEPLNRGTQTVESSMTVNRFVEEVYMPYVELQKQPSTIRGYKEVWHRHIEPRARWRCATCARSRWS
jgi:hypothetical protein